MQKSKIFIISGPSAAGEDSIIKGLREVIDFEKIVTSTTRAMRTGDIMGDPYYFISKNEFTAGIESNEFYEYVQQDGGNYYGVTKKEIERAINSGKPVIWKIEYKGAIKAKNLFPDSVAILIDVPLEVIEKRIRLRDNPTEEYLQTRLEYAKGWYQNKDKFDYSIKNEDGKLSEAIQEVVKIINPSI